MSKFFKQIIIMAILGVLLVGLGMTVVVQTTQSRSPLNVSPKVASFVTDAMQDCVNRYGPRLGTVSFVAIEDLAEWRKDSDISQLVTSFVPTGPTRDALEGVSLCQPIRPYDADAWPHATHGFFRFKEKIPRLLGQLRGIELA